MLPSWLAYYWTIHGWRIKTGETLNLFNVICITKHLLQIEEELKVKIYMVNIDECLIEKEQCEDSCRNVLTKSNMPAAVYTNTTSFIGVNVRVESECQCLNELTTCLNGGELRLKLIMFLS